MNLFDKLRKHAIYSIFTLIVAVASIVWVVANEVVVKQKNSVIEEKNAIIERLNYQLKEEQKKLLMKKGIINNQGTAMRDNITPKVSFSGTQTVNLMAFKYVTDLLTTISNDRAGVRFDLVDESVFNYWIDNLLAMLRDIFAIKQKDVYVAWLRPAEANSKRLQVFMEKYLPKIYSHYEFHFGEGLAGKVWSTGMAAATSRLRQHTWWVYREGCYNTSYICVPVGSAGSKAGILSVGSDLGFDVTEEDVEIVKLFASLLIIVPDITPIERFIREKKEQDKR